MFNAHSSFLSQSAPTCRIVGWSLNRSVAKAMEQVHIDKSDSVPKFFADTEPCQFPPWPIHERLGFGDDLLPKLVRALNVTRREKPLLQLLRSLEHLLSDPLICAAALKLDLLKALTSLLLLQKSFDVRMWVLASLRVIAGNPEGKSAIVERPILLSEILNNFNAPDKVARQIAYTILFRLSENWLVVNDLQKAGCIRLVIKTIFALSMEEWISESEQSIVCLLDTLANLIDYRNGVLKAIRYDLFDLKWLLSCGLIPIEEAMLKVFVRVAKDEIGRLGLRYKYITQQLLSSFYDAIAEREDPVLVGTLLMFSTLDNSARSDYYKMNVTKIVMDVFREPNLSNATRLVFIRMLTNIAELPLGRATLHQHLQWLITIPTCDVDVQESLNVLIKKILRNP